MWEDSVSIKKLCCTKILLCTWYQTPWKSMFPLSWHQMWHAQHFLICGFFVHYMTTSLLLLISLIIFTNQYIWWLVFLRFIILRFDNGITIEESFRFLWSFKENCGIYQRWQVQSWHSCHGLDSHCVKHSTLATMSIHWFLLWIHYVESYMICQNTTRICRGLIQMNVKNVGSILQKEIWEGTTSLERRICVSEITNSKIANARNALWGAVT